jgi:hypothetical protein
MKNTAAQATAIKARPFVCTAEEVRGILGGGAVQIRRPIFPKHIAWAKGCGSKDFDTIGSFRPNRQGVLSAWLANYPGVSVGEAACPHGRPGDQLWVKEVWAKGVTGPIYQADFDVSDGFGSWVIHHATGDMVPLQWLTASRMPKWPSRITLEITAVTPERSEEKGPWVWAIEARRIEP